MTRVYRLITDKAPPEYCGDRATTDQRAQALADQTNETVTIEYCWMVDLSPPRLVAAILNGKDWCKAHRVQRYVKPRRQKQRTAA